MPGRPRWILPGGEGATPTALTPVGRHPRPDGPEAPGKGDMMSTSRFPRAGLPLPGLGRPLLRPVSHAIDVSWGPVPAVSQPGSLSAC